MLREGFLLAAKGRGLLSRQLHDRPMQDALAGTAGAGTPLNNAPFQH